MAGGMKSRRKQMYRRHIVVSSVASGLLAGAPSAMADCVDADGWQCEYRSGETYTSVQGVSKAGYSPPHSEGTTDGGAGPNITINRSEEHTSELQSRENLVCRLLLEKKKQVE